MSSLYKIISSAILISFSIQGTFAQRIKETYLKGTIDKYPVEMVISDNHYTDQDGVDHSFYSGHYYYNSKLIPIYFSENTDKVKSGETELMVYSMDGAMTEQFIGTYANTQFKGQWKSNNKSYVFNLHATSPKIEIENLRLEKKGYYKDNPQLYHTYLANWDLPKDPNLQKLVIQTFTDDKFQDFRSMASSDFALESSDYEKMIEESLQYDSLGAIEDSYMYRYERSSSVIPVVNSDIYLILAKTEYMYSGGAHGMYYTQYLNYSHLAKGILDLEDILDLKHEDQIATLIKRIIKQKYNIPAATPLDESDTGMFISDEVTLSKNFTINNEGLTFYYGLYELTPYVAGIFEIQIPKEHLLPFLNKSFHWQ